MHDLILEPGYRAVAGVGRSKLSSIEHNLCAVGLEVTRESWAVTSEQKLGVKGEPPRGGSGMRVPGRERGAKGHE